MAKGVAGVKVPKLSYIINYDEEKKKFIAKVLNSEDHEKLEGLGRTAKSALDALGRKIVKPVVNI